MRNKRNRTPLEHIGHGLYLYFLGLSLRNVVRALSFLHIVKRSHVAVWKWIQKYKPRRKMVSRKRDVSEYVVDETLVKTGSELVWIWVAIEPKSRLILALSLSKERNMLIAEKFLSGLVKVHGKRPVSTDGGTWYPQACKFLKLTHRIHSSHEKSLIERAMQYIKDRTEGFDDYFPCRKARCNLHHIKNWLNLFVIMHNKKTINA
jgi:putative transposase